MVTNLCVVFFEKTLFKTSIISHRLSLLSEFIFDTESKRIIKSRYGVDTEVYKDILRRVKNHEDIPYLFDIVSDKVFSDNRPSSTFNNIQEYLRYKYTKRLKE